MKTAFPFFLLSGISLVLWIRPGGRFVLTIPELEMLMRVEGLVLIVCVLLTLAAVLTIKNPFTSYASGEKADEKDSGPLTVFAGGFGIALVIGGLVALALGGDKAAYMYCISLVLHLVGTFKLSLRETGVEFGVNALALLAFVVLGMLIQKMPALPSYGVYPAGFSVAGYFRIEGNQVLAWAFAYFLVLGLLHLTKQRVFAHFRRAENQAQTPR